MLGEPFQKFETVSEGVGDVEAVGAGEWLAGIGRNAKDFQAGLKGGDVAYGEGRMGLFRRREGAFNADMKLLRAAGEPDTAPRLQVRRLLDLLQAQNLAEEAAGGFLAAWRGGKLDMIDPFDCERVHISIIHGRDS